jgi:hypothetical protein
MFASQYTVGLVRGDNDIDTAASYGFDQSGCHSKQLIPNNNREPLSRKKQTQSKNHGPVLMLAN